MKSIHDVFEDETSAAILAQITKYGGKITASKISKNINIPLSTVYNHLRELEKDKFIIAEETRIKNLIKKYWRRTEKRINPKDSLIRNQKFNKLLPSDPLSANSYIKFLIARLREEFQKLKSMNTEKFASYQRDSNNPFNVLMLHITKEDYEFVLGKLFEIHDELQKRNKESMNPDRSHTLPDETFLFFYLALPDLQQINY